MQSFASHARLAFNLRLNEHLPSCLFEQHILSQHTLMLSLLKSFSSSETINTCLYFHRLSCKFISRWKWCCYVNGIKLSTQECNPAGSVLAFESAIGWPWTKCIKIPEFIAHLRVVSFWICFWWRLKSKSRNGKRKLWIKWKSKNLHF